MTYPIRKDIAESHSMFVLAHFRYNTWYFASNGGKDFYRHVPLLQEILYWKEKKSEMCLEMKTYIWKVYIPGT